METKKSRFTKEQIIGFLKEHPAGIAVPALCRNRAISDATFCAWWSKNGGMEISDAKRLKSLEEENRKLKKLLAESMLDVAMVREVLTKGLLKARSAERIRELGD